MQTVRPGWLCGVEVDQIKTHGDFDRGSHNSSGGQAAHGSIGLDPALVAPTKRALFDHAGS